MPLAFRSYSDTYYRVLGVVTFCLARVFIQSAYLAKLIFEECIHKLLIFCFVPERQDQIASRISAHNNSGSGCGAHYVVETGSWGGHLYRASND